MKEFLAQVANFYFGSPKAIPIVIILYIIPVVIIIALGYLGVKGSELILKWRGYPTKEEQWRDYVKRDAEGKVKKEIETICAELEQAKQREATLNSHLRASDNECSKNYKKIKSLELEIQRLNASFATKESKLQEIAENQYQRGLNSSHSYDTLPNANQLDDNITKAIVKVEDAEISKKDYSTYEYGEEFERKILALLETELAKNFESSEEKFKLLHHVYLKNSKRECDIVLLLTSGIYFIECKSWAGLVIGKKEWNRWIQIRCKFSENRVPIFEKGLSAQYFPSPYKQVHNQRDDMALFLRSYEKERNYATPKISEFPNKFSKRMIVMDNLNGDTNSNVSLDETAQSDEYFWYGTSDKLIERIMKYHNDIANEPNHFYQEDVNGNLNNKMLELYNFLKEQQNKADWRQ